METQTAETKLTNRQKREKFIRTWVEVCKSDNPSCQAVADKLGLTVATVRAKSVTFRKELGESFPKMPRGGTRTDHEADRRLLAELLGSDDQGEDTEGKSEDS